MRKEASMKLHVRMLFEPIINNLSNHMIIILGSSWAVLCWHYKARRFFLVFFTFSLFISISLCFFFQSINDRANLTGHNASSRFADLMNRYSLCLRALRQHRITYTIKALGTKSS